MPDQLKFHFIKGEGCREMIVDGAFGGLTPSGKISMAVYAERLPIPQETVYPISDLGELGEEIRELRIERKDIIRVVQSVLHMDVATAKAVHRWIGEKIDQLEKMTAQTPTVTKP